MRWHGWSRTGRRFLLPGLGTLLVLLVSLGLTGSQAAFTARVTSSTNTLTVVLPTCRSSVLADTPLRFHPMGDGAGAATVADVSPARANGTFVGTRSAPTTGPCARDTTGADTFTRSNGGNSGTSVTGSSLAGPTASWTTEAWIRTTQASGLVTGLANTASGASTTQDRALFLDKTGDAVFGVVTSNGTRTTLSSPSVVNDGTWHHLVGTVGGGTMTLYVDGTAVATQSGVTASTRASSFVRIGVDDLGSWGLGGNQKPNNDYYAGQIAGVAVYGTALPATRVAAHHAARQ